MQQPQHSKLFDVAITHMMLCKFAVNGIWVHQRLGHERELLHRTLTFAGCMYWACVSGSLESEVGYMTGMSQPCLPMQ